MPPELLACRLGLVHAPCALRPVRVGTHSHPADDMKTKNRTDRSGAVPAAPASAAAAAANGAAAAAKARAGGEAAAGQPRLECEQGRKWVVENQVGAGCA